MSGASLDAIRWRLTERQITVEQVAANHADCVTIDLERERNDESQHHTADLCRGIAFVLC